jgi:hypothetical protein
VAAFRRAVHDAIAGGILPAIPKTLAMQAIPGRCNWTDQQLDPQGALPAEQVAGLLAFFVIDLRPLQQGDKTTAPGAS